MMAICTVLFEKLYTILRKNETRRKDITNISFTIFKIMPSLRSSNLLKTTAELTLTAQKANA